MKLITLTHRVKNLKSLATGLALIATVFVLACGTGQSAAPVVAVEAADFSFQMPATFDGGLTRIAMTNVGQESHHVQILKLNDGVSQAQFQSVLDGVVEAIPTEGVAAVLGLFQASTLAGGPATAGPGGKSDAVLDLEPGHYAFVCLLLSRDGVPHFAKGMVAVVEVMAEPETTAEEPTAVATVTLSDFAFAGVPASLPAGESTLKIVNAGQEPHEMVMVRLNGMTVEQVGELLTRPPTQAPGGPPPFEFVGGYQAVIPGGTGWAVFDLEPGEYGLICLVPSPANGFKPHFALGMVNSITVQ